MAITESTTSFEQIEVEPEGLAQRMLEAIQAEIPTYRRAAPRLVDDVRDQCLRHARLLPVVLGAGRMPSRDELEFIRAAARRRAHGDVSLDVFLHALRVAHGVMWEEISRSAAAELVRRLGTALIEYFDLVSTLVAEAYLREEQRIHALADRERRDLVENLVLGRPPEIEGVHPAAPGIDPTGQLMVVIAKLDDVDGLHHVADALAATTRGHLGRPLVVARQAEVIALVAAGEGVGEHLEKARSVLRDRRGLDLVAGVSSSLAGFAGVRRGYVEAEHALRQTRTERPIVAAGEIPALDYLLMSADAATRSVIAARGAPLADLAPAKRQALVDTVTAYVEEDFNVTRAGHRLALTPNTVRYRLDRIGEITGHDLRRLEDTIDLLCVLRLG